VKSDTAPEVDVRLDALLARKSGSDRVRMMSEMFEGARTLAIADIMGSRPDVTDTDVRLELFERFYGEDFSDDERRRICERLAAR
jgi:hypothetical protein